MSQNNNQPLTDGNEMLEFLETVTPLKNDNASNYVDGTGMNSA